jgi:hypothetical protein
MAEIVRQRPRIVTIVCELVSGRMAAHVRINREGKPRGSGATEAAAREDVRRVAENLKAPYEDFNGEAFLIVPS